MIKGGRAPHNPALFPWFAGRPQPRPLLPLPAVAWRGTEPSSGLVSGQIHFSQGSESDFSLPGPLDTHPSMCLLSPFTHSLPAKPQQQSLRQKRSRVHCLLALGSQAPPLSLFISPPSRLLLSTCSWARSRPSPQLHQVQMSSLPRPWGNRGADVAPPCVARSRRTEPWGW